MVEGLERLSGFQDFPALCGFSGPKYTARPEWGLGAPWGMYLSVTLVTASYPTAMKTDPLLVLALLVLTVSIAVLVLSLLQLLH
jgi:hypothetical protein